jgi:hypothetical protein
MTPSLLTQLARLRLLVGYLGEQPQYTWWLSAFFTPSSPAFLSPIFSKTVFMAQYQGVKAAASRVHDDHIGLGKVYHLFRLPERLEHALFQRLHDTGFVDDLCAPLDNKEHALACLAATCADTHPTSVQGPVLVGEMAALMHGKTVGLLAQYYWTAFTHSLQVYPYYVEQL